jgi:flavin-dependent dehydrogenase
VRPVARIAGGGPSGLVAALLLARAGVRVELREKRAQVGARFSGAVHGIENWSTRSSFARFLAELDPELEAVATPCHDLSFCDDERARHVHSAEPLFYLVQRGPERGAIEATLLRLAREAGADVRLGASFAPGEADFDATGPRSEQRFCVETGFHFRTSAPDLAAALVSREATPAGYAYLLVRSGIGSLCAVRFDGRPVARAQLEACERSLLRHVPLDTIERWPGAGFGAFTPLGHLVRGNAWAIGEAAGLQDALWGFGIRRALESAALAARAWIEGADYSQVCRERLGLPDRAALVNRCLWDATAARWPQLYAHLLCRRGDVRGALRRATREAWPHRVLYPLVRPWLRQRLPRLAVPS